MPRVLLPNNMLVAGDTDGELKNRLQFILSCFERGMPSCGSYAQKKKKCSKRVIYTSKANECVPRTNFRFFVKQKGFYFLLNL